jgi:serine/threonine-protein kinase HipA
VRSATRPSAPQVLRLLDYVICNVLIGNHDAQAKNLSMLFSGGKSAKPRSSSVLRRAVNGGVPNPDTENKAAVDPSI